MFPLVTGSNRPIFPKSSAHLKEKIREGNDLSTHILKQAVFDNQKLTAYMYLSEHLRKHTFMWEPGEKINLKELAIWKHFLEMGTSHVLNAESSNLWRVTDLRGREKKPFHFRLCNSVLLEFVCLYDLTSFLKTTTRRKEVSFTSPNMKLGGPEQIYRDITEVSTSGSLPGLRT